jgi:hypothetical protein
MTDIDDLKATFEQVVSAICRRDASAYSALWDEQIVAFPPFSPLRICSLSGRSVDRFTVGIDRNLLMRRGSLPTAGDSAQ